MAADGKWIAGLTADAPLGVAARRAFAARLAAVEKTWRPAVNNGTDPENVHQLRVSTRRAAAALDIFGDLPAAKSAHRLRKQLRKLRRGAATARDWDVFRLMVTAWAPDRPPAEQPGLDFLIGLAAAHRQRAQTELSATLGREKHWQAVRRKLLRTIPNAGGSTLGDRAKKLLKRILDELETALHRKPLDDDALHRVRIAGKRLRYALELFIKCFNPTVRQRVYPAVEQMQEILGRANDSRVTIDRLNELQAELRRGPPGTWNRVRAGVLALIADHRRGLARERSEFSRWRKDWQALRPGELLLQPVGGRG